MNLRYSDVNTLTAVSISWLCVGTWNCCRWLPVCERSMHSAAMAVWLRQWLCRRVGRRSRHVWYANLSYLYMLHISDEALYNNIIIIIIIIWAQPRNVRLSSKSPNILVWRTSVSSSQLRWSRLVHSMRQLVSFWRISGEGSPPSQLTRERVPSCSKGYLLSFSDSTLSCSTTVLRRQTTWANGYSSVYIF